MTATLDIRAPADQTEGTRSQILRWLKAVGETVTEHEPLIELETDKVTVEVAAPASGILREIVKAEQEEVVPGEVLGRLETSAQSGAIARSDVDAESNAGEGGVAGADNVATAVSSKSIAEPNTASSVGAIAPNSAPRVTPDSPGRLSPAVRRLLSERGLDASAVRGTGEGGRVTVDDVLAHNSAGSVEAALTTHPSAAPAKQDEKLSPGYTGARARTIPHSAVRKRIADHMVHSLLETAPHVTTVFEADLSAVIAHRSAHRAEFEARGVPLTFTAYFLAASVNAIHAVPEANSRWTDSALEIYDNIHIGIATAVEGTGLMVPVLRNVQTLDLLGIAQSLDQLVSAAREGELEPADVRGGTFTISNHGVSGSVLATPIVIHQPQSAILGIGKLEKRAVVIVKGDEEAIVVRPRCYVTLTIDHRVMDGHQANRFLQTFVRALEAWPLDSP